MPETPARPGDEHTAGDAQPGGSNTVVTAPVPHLMLNAVIEGCPSHICVIDAAGIVLQVNSGFTKRFSSYLGEVRAGMHYRAATQRRPMLQAVVSRNLARCLEGERFDSVITLPGWESPDPAFRTHYEPLFDASGKITAAAMFITEVTAEMESARLARERDDAFRSAFEYAPIGMALVGVTGRFLRVNDSLCRMLGYSANELLQGEFQKLTHPGDLDRDLENVRRVLAGIIKFYAMEKRYIHKDGHVVWTQLYVTLVKNEDGSPKYFVSQVQDISAQKRHEQELTEARDRAQAADKAKSSFLAVMSHEIRTPMNAVLGFADLLMGTTLDEEQHEYAQTIARSGELLIGLINNILDFSKIEAGHLELESSPVAPASIVGEVASVCAVHAREKGLKVHTLIDPSLPEHIMGDSLRLHQVLMNLVGNAIKFTSHGTVAVEARREWHDQGERIRLSVADTGIGMDAETTTRLFQPFTQADSSITRRYGGTGLGLAICKRLVEAMGGEIGVDSERGGGSTFQFWLPLRPAADDVAPCDTVGTVPAPVSTHAATGDMLIVEDCRNNAVLLSRMIEHLGYRCACVDDGPACLEAVRERSYRAIFMDLQMPGMTGMETARRIRGREQDAGSATRHRIIAVTADVQPEIREECIRAGMDAFLEKPVRLSDLAALLQKLAGTAAQEV